MRDDQPDLFDALTSERIAGAPPARPVETSLPTSARSWVKGRQSKIKSAEPVVLVLPFPLVARVGKIRDVAAKMVATKSERHAAAYRAQVTEALRVNLSSKRVPEEQHAGELRQFWQAVDLEVARLLNPSRRPGGGTA